MKGVVLKSVAAAPLIFGIPHPVFYGLIGVLVTFMCFECSILGLVMVIPGYIAAFSMTQQDPYFVEALSKALCDPQPLQNKPRKTGYFRRYYNA